MDVASWLVSEHDDTVFRMTTQILEMTPLDRRRERFGAGNCMDWAMYHIARHTSLGLRVVGHEPAMSESLLAGIDPIATEPGAGLQEEEQPWLDVLDSEVLEAYLLSVLDEVRAFRSGLDAASLDAPRDIAAALQRAGLPIEQYPWLYAQWGKPGAVLRWTLGGHITFHAGELAGMRNQLGLSAFR